MNKGGTGGARRPKGPLRGDVEGHVGGGRASRRAETRGIRPHRLQDWGAHGPGDCRIGGHKATEVAGPTDTESLRQEAVWHRDPAEWGSWTAGESGTECDGYEIGGSPGEPRLQGYPGNCRWVGMGEYTPFRIPKSRGWW